MTTPSAHSLPRCPVEVTLSLISSRWVVLILRELIYGTRRFGQIRKALGGACLPARPSPRCPLA